MQWSPHTAHTSEVHVTTQDNGKAIRVSVCLCIQWTVVITTKNKNKEFDESPLLKLGKMCQRWGKCNIKDIGYTGQIKVEQVR